MPVTLDAPLEVVAPALDTRLSAINIDADNMKIKLSFLLLDANGDTVGVNGGDWVSLLEADGATPAFEVEDHAEFAATMASMKALLYKFGMKHNIIPTGTVS